VLGGFFVFLAMRALDREFRLSPLKAAALRNRGWQAKILHEDRKHNLKPPGRGSNDNDVVTSHPISILVETTR